MSLRDRVKNILMQPQREWQVIAREPASVGELYLSYVAPLAAIGPLASVVGLSVIGYGSPVTARYRVALGSSVLQALVTYVSSLEDDLQAFKLAAYSSTAAWVAGVFRLIPALDVLVLLGLYSLYLLYLGVPVLMRVPERNVVGYTATVIIAAFAIFFVLGLINSLLFPQSMSL